MTEIERRRGPAISAGLLVCATMMAADVAQAQQIKVDWTDPEIGSFVSQRAANPPRTLGLSQPDKLSLLKLPVLAFDTPPQLVQNSLAPGTQPSMSREVVMDENDPTWYQINDQYGDITVSVAADIRVNQELPKSSITPSAQSISPQSEPHISVFDANVEEGLEGLIIEYTVYKFPNIPYTVTIECGRETKERCRDVGVVAADKALLKLIAAHPE